MSIEVTLITSLLSTVIGSKTIAEALVELYRKKIDEKSSDSGDLSDTVSIVADRKPVYLTEEKEVEIATDAAIEALDITYSSTALIRDERMRQAKIAFNVAISLMIVGVLIIFCGVALLWIKEGLESGLATVAVGTVSEVLSVIVFGFNKETNNRLDVIHKDLSAIETARVGLSIAKQIEDQEKRDHAISELSIRIQNG